MIQRFPWDLGVGATLNSLEESVLEKGADSVVRKESVATVLLVEDTEDTRQMMRRLLEMSGFRVVEAVNGRQAIELALEVRPQIILMDLSLPFIDGIAATRQIRGTRELSKVPIVVVSAHDTTDFHNLALDAGCNAYVTKPVHYPELEELVNSLLASHS